MQVLNRVLQVWLRIVSYYEVDCLRLRIGLNNYVLNSQRAQTLILWLLKSRPLTRNPECFVLRLGTDFTTILLDSKKYHWVTQQSTWLILELQGTEEFLWISMCRRDRRLAMSRRHCTGIYPSHPLAGKVEALKIAFLDWIVTKRFQNQENFSNKNIVCDSENMGPEMQSPLLKDK